VEPAIILHYDDKIFWKFFFEKVKIRKKNAKILEKLAKLLKPQDW